MVFDAIQFAGIVLDFKLCVLLMNAHVVAGQSDEACIVFENRRNASLDPSDKCMAVVLGAQGKENMLKKGKTLDLLIDLKRYYYGWQRNI